MKNSISAKLTKSIVLLSIVILIALITCGAYLTYNIVFNEIGSARLDLLRQVSDYNITYLSTMEHITDDFKETILEKGIGRYSEEILKAGMAKVESSINTIGWNCTFDIIMQDGSVINSDYNTARAGAIKNTYWYILLWSGHTEPQWELSSQNLETNEYKITYAVPIFDAAGETHCVAVLSCLNKAMPSSLLSLNRSGTTFYVINENGKVISHTNARIVGFSFYYMPEFENREGAFNSFSVKHKNDEWQLQTNYHSDVTGWTYVEDVSIVSILSDYETMVILFLTLLFGGFALLIFMIIVIMRRMTQPLEAFAGEIQGLTFDDDNYPCRVTEQKQYGEIEVITRNFNLMIQKVCDMIDQIKRNEKEKHKAEYEFLQAQIEPHFLRNTLLAIKALIALGETDRAVTMLENFNEILRVPLMRDNGNVTLMDEIDLIRRFIAIMEYRFDLKIEVVAIIPKPFGDVLLPRMILQPIVDNAIFHGFEDMPSPKTPIITITAYQRDDTLVIQIIDNGHGMEETRVGELMNGTYVRKGKRNNGIGIPNVLNRIRLLYGPRATIHIESVVGEGTRVQMILPNFRRIMDNNGGAPASESADR